MVIWCHLYADLVNPLMVFANHRWPLRERSGQNFMELNVTADKDRTASEAPSLGIKRPPKAEEVITANLEARRAISLRLLLKPKRNRAVGAANRPSGSNRRGHIERDLQGSLPSETKFGCMGITVS